MVERRHGPLTAYRIADGRHTIFDGTGAALQGGRWNAPGRSVIYASENFAGALLERFARANIGMLPRTQRWIRIDVPAGVAIEVVAEADVPGWDGAPDNAASRGYGDAWLLESRSAVLVVPSLVGRPVERNVLLNPRHPDFPRIAATEPREVMWDPPLLPGTA